MNNIAGVPNHIADENVRRELTRCGVLVEEYRKPEDHPEVRTRYRGILGSYKFERSWCYWIVYGLIPAFIAKELYEHPVGKTDIRVNGDCTCPNPEEAFSWYTPDGKLVLPTREEEGFEQLKHYFPTYRETRVFHDDPETLGAVPFIDGYHVDSELGLYLLVQALKREGLDKSPRESENVPVASANTHPNFLKWYFGLANNERSEYTSAPCPTGVS